MARMNKKRGGSRRASRGGRAKKTGMMERSRSRRSGKKQAIPAVGGEDLGEDVGAGGVSYGERLIGSSPGERLGGRTGLSRKGGSDFESHPSQGVGRGKKLRQRSSDIGRGDERSGEGWDEGG